MGDLEKKLFLLKNSHFPDQVIDCLFVHKDYQNKKILGESKNKYYRSR